MNSHSSLARVAVTAKGCQECIYMKKWLGCQSLLIDVKVHPVHIDNLKKEDFVKIEEK